VTKKTEGLKVAVNNTNQENTVKGAKRPKYITLGDGKQATKVLTPKKIIPIKMQGHDFMVFGDPRCSKILLPLTMLQMCKKKNEVLIALRTKKSKQHPRGMMVFSRTFDDLLKSRKWRLVNAQSIFMMYETLGMACETPVQFMKGELEMNHDVEIDPEELEIQFLSSLNDGLICKDIVRVLQLYHQESQKK